MTNHTPLIDRALAQVGPVLAQQDNAWGTITPVPRLKLWSSPRTTPPTPSMLEPMFYVVLRGTKQLEIGNQWFDLTAGDCVTTCFDLPYVSRVVEATRTSPYVAISLALDLDALTRVMLDMPKAEDRWVCSASRSTFDGPVGEAFNRVLGLLSSPGDVGVLAPHYEAELYYRLLQSSMGDMLRQLGQRDSRLRQIRKAADWLCFNPGKSFVVADLAASVGMSLTSFHRHFKQVTGYSPIAFQHHVRLLEARKMLMGNSGSVSDVAYAVGYLSTSQFSREYKRMFGTPPLLDLGAGSL